MQWMELNEIWYGKDEIYIYINGSIEKKASLYFEFSDNKSILDIFAYIAQILYMGWQYIIDLIK